MKKILLVGVYQHLGYQGVDWNYLFAAISFAYIVPMIIYLVFSRNIVEGTTLGAIKEQISIGGKP